MTITAESTCVRRYLLGQLSEDECTVVEREYLEHSDAIDRIASVEDQLIEEYLTHRLSPDDRARFERAYLPVPHRRVRIATVRGLMAHGSRLLRGDAARANAARAQARPAHAVRADEPRTSPVEPERMLRGQWTGLAVSLLLGACGGLWVCSPFGAQHAPIIGAPVEHVEASQTPPPNAPVPPADERIIRAPASGRPVTVTLLPVGVQSASETPTVVVPAGTGVVTMHLAEESGAPPLAARRASIRVVGGEDVWRGSIADEEHPPPGTVARIDVPAASLPSDHYLVTLYGADPTGADREWTHYFLRVRSH